MELATVKLTAGNHESVEKGVCIMEAVAAFAKEPHSDHPKCVCPSLTDFSMRWNDDMNDEDRQMLVPLIPIMVGTRGSAALELRRRFRIMDWYARELTPTWLELAGLNDEAAALRTAAQITDGASAKAIEPAIFAARDASAKRAAAAWDAAWAAAWAAARDAAWAAARDAAWAAARDAARAAAWDAARAAAWAAARDAAWAAARDAAWDAARAAAWAAARDAAWAAARDAAWAAARDAARAAAWDAARAAAWDAARDAAWAAVHKKLRPTVVVLQASALELLRELCAMKDAE